MLLLHRAHQILDAHIQCRHVEDAYPGLTSALQIQDLKQTFVSPGARSQRLVPLKCAYDEHTRTYGGKKKVMGRLAGQMITMIYALLKQDQEVLRRTLPAMIILI